MDIAGHFHQVSMTAEEMMSLIGDWSGVEKMRKHLGERSIREKLGGLRKFLYVRPRRHKFMELDSDWEK